MIELNEIVEAYFKLRNYFYYNNKDLQYHKRLAEWEESWCAAPDSNASVELDPIDLNISKIYSDLPPSLLHRLKKVKNWINSYNDQDKIDPADKFCDIRLFYMLKKIRDKKDRCWENENFITNQSILPSYEIDEVTIFGDVSIELHLVTILWIMRYGYIVDASFGNSCLGNRLHLTPDGELAKGSQLFKPYYHQYEKWRDDAFDIARYTLRKGDHVGILNLDVKDYFYSTHLDFSEMYNYMNQVARDREIEIKEHEGLKRIFEQIHIDFTEKVREVKYPAQRWEENNEKTKVILPIGLASSYILANYYLRDFDYAIQNQTAHIYYGRYVDDILIVIKNPPVDSSAMKDSKIATKEGGTWEDGSHSELTRLESFIKSHFSCDFRIQSSKTEDEHDDCKKPEVGFEIKRMPGLEIQSKKTIFYYFDHTQPITVLDKLKRDLWIRASEFRSFPQKTRQAASFADAAHHLIYDGSEGQPATLKDYKINRYGIGIYLGKMIAMGLDLPGKLDQSEKTKILTLFQGKYVLQFQQFWERIFILFLVYKDRDGFYRFFHAVHDAIKKIPTGSDGKLKMKDSKVLLADVQKNLYDYLRTAISKALALYPDFMEKDPSREEGLKSFIYGKNNEDEKLRSYPEIENFRRHRLIRSQYIKYPLTHLAITENDHYVDLTDIPDLSDPHLWKPLSDLHGQSVKFWECCIRAFTETLHENAHLLQEGGTGEDSKESNLSTSKMLEKAWEYYYKINKYHYPRLQKNKDGLRPFRDLRTSPDPHTTKTQTAGTDLEITEIHIKNEKENVTSPRVALVNMEVQVKQTGEAIKGNSSFTKEQYDDISKILNDSSFHKTNLLIFPENAIPLHFVPSLTQYAVRRQKVNVAGLQHIHVTGRVYNFILTIVPYRIDSMDDAMVIYRLKNHYAPIEEEAIKGYHYQPALPGRFRYDIINWRNLYFTSFYCFELADIFHRSAFRSRVDLVIASEFNPDTNYYSNIIESFSRDMHAYLAQVNISQYGDSRRLEPKKTEQRKQSIIKGGHNSSVIVGQLDLPGLREFQRKTYAYTQQKGKPPFKPLSPGWDWENVLKRKRNEFVLPDSSGSLEEE